ncbi:hypothetical protein ACLOJK_023080, partial [Asimina triloba]
MLASHSNITVSMTPRSQSTTLRSPPSSLRTFLTIRGDVEELADLERDDGGDPKSHVEYIGSRLLDVIWLCIDSVHLILELAVLGKIQVS